MAKRAVPKRLGQAVVMGFTLIALAGCPTIPPAPEPPPPTPVVVAPVEPIPVPKPQPTPDTQPIPTPPPVVAPVAPPKQEPYPPMKAGDSLQYILIDGNKRAYRLHIPAAYTGSDALPLVVLLHMRGSSAQSARLLGFNQKAETARFIVAYPEAIGQPRIWNAGHESNATKANDVAYVTEMVAAIRRLMNIDARRIYIAGHSSGGMMAYRVAAELSPVVAAVSVIGASIGSRDANGAVQRVREPAQPVSVLHIHGRQDRTVPMAGGRSATLVGADYVSVRDTITFWTQANKCATTKPRIGPSGSVIRESYGECAGGTTVELLTLNSGGHEWPRAISIETRKVQNAADVMWDFFSAQVKR